NQRVFVDFVFSWFSCPPPEAAGDPLLVSTGALAHQVLVEPADDVLEALDAVPGTARTRELVALSGETHHDGRALEVLQRPEEILAAGGRGRPEILVAENEHQRRLDPRDVGDRRS